MRDIKFRAWSNDKKKMVSWSELIRNRELLWSVMGNEHYTTSPPRYLWERMQFTGLRDINGQEIYEGDIMQHANPFDIPFVVNWIDENCAFEFNSGTTSYHITDKSFTVIGNIYENPELLNNE